MQEELHAECEGMAFLVEELRRFALSLPEEASMPETLPEPRIRIKSPRELDRGSEDRKETQDVTRGKVLRYCGNWGGQEELPWSSHGRRFLFFLFCEADGGGRGDLLRRKLLSEEHPEEDSEARVHEEELHLALPHDLPRGEGKRSESWTSEGAAPGRPTWTRGWSGGDTAGGRLER